MKILSSVFIVTLWWGAAGALNGTSARAFAVETASEQGNLPPPVVERSSAGLIEKNPGLARNTSGMLAVAPKSLMEQRLHEAVYPAEAEVRCFLATSCEFGLSRGFAFGADLGSIFGTPLIKPIVNPGRWLVFDGYLGFQFLRAVDENVYFNAAIGYRFLESKDSDDRIARTSGLTFKFAYAQQVVDFYSQGVLVNGYYASNTVKDVGDDLTLIQATSGDRKFIDRFYEFSQAYPRFRLGLPADFEIINWKSSSIDLPSHLRGYARVEPFFTQNEFKGTFPQISEYKFVERDYGVRMAYLMSYTSPKEQAGRMGYLAALGLDVQVADSEVTYESNQPTQVSLPERKTFSLYWELGLSYQL